eukprot:CAMPEP_0176048644 /NCGR_PEP_ID=MMETSP0120_2-20121206/24165_1 /TAXON_ID=160619 /ORGANISM="Kryptoperidinium foliaceum, Strain CCMP 1326" /LENGTH=84 /DNA_ID=CAMNT_0017382063 /DNA_START=116 /DNA_END=366 /DNA_ORIENTATION=-
MTGVSMAGSSSDALNMPLCRDRANACAIDPLTEEQGVLPMRAWSFRQCSAALRDETESEQGGVMALLPRRGVTRSFAWADEDAE